MCSIPVRRDRSHEPLGVPHSQLAGGHVPVAVSYNQPVGSDKRTTGRRQAGSRPGTPGGGMLRPCPGRPRLPARGRTPPARKDPHGSLAVPAVDGPQRRPLLHEDVAPRLHGPGPGPALLLSARRNGEEGHRLQRPSQRPRLHDQVREMERRHAGGGRRHHLPRHRQGRRGHRGPRAHVPHRLPPPGGLRHRHRSHARRRRPSLHRELSSSST